MKKKNKVTSDKPSLWLQLKQNFSWLSLVRNKQGEGYKQCLKENKPVGWNIYDFKNRSEAVRKEDKVHGWFKYRFFVPLLLIGERVLGNALVKGKSDIPDTWYNEEMRLFDDLFEKSIHDWAYVYLRNSRGYDPSTLEKRLAPISTVKEWLVAKPSILALRIMKRFIEGVARAPPLPVFQI